MIKLFNILNEIRPRGGITFIIKPTFKIGGDIISHQLNIEMSYHINAQDTEAIINVSSEYDLMIALMKKFGTYQDEEMGEDEDVYYPVDESAYFCDNNLHHFENFFGEAKTKLDNYNCSQIVIPIELFNKKIKN